MLIKPEESLLECLVMNADPKNDADYYEFDLKTVVEYRKKMLSAPIKDGKAVLDALTDQRKAEAEDDDMDWKEEILGEMEGGYVNCRFSSYWDDDTEMTYPLILAKIPVKNPWEIFAYLPFGNWNECPGTEDLMAVAKYWFEQYSAVPGAMSHDELEFNLPAPPAPPAVPLPTPLKQDAVQGVICLGVQESGRPCPAHFRTSPRWLCKSHRNSCHWTVPAAGGPAFDLEGRVTDQLFDLPAVQGRFGWFGHLFRFAIACSWQE